MYTKTVQIPNVGDAASFPSVEGEALQVERLDFQGARDPLGNPVVSSRSRSFQVRLNPGNPIRQPFDGIEIRNESNDEAAGTRAVLRVYEDATRLTSASLRRQPTTRAKADFESHTLQASFTAPDNGRESVELIPSGRARAWAVLGLTGVVYPDGSVVEGFPLRVQIELKSQRRGVSRKQSFNVVPGREQHFELVQATLPVPPSASLEVQSVGWTGTGNESCAVDIDGLAFEDKNSPFPLR